MYQFNDNVKIYLKRVKKKRQVYNVRERKSLFVRAFCGENTALACHARWRLGRQGWWFVRSRGCSWRRSVESTVARGGWVWPGSRGERVRGGCTGGGGKGVNGEARRGEATGERTGTLG